MVSLKSIGSAERQGFFQSFIGFKGIPSPIFNIVNSILKFSDQKVTKTVVDNMRETLRKHLEGQQENLRRRIHQSCANILHKSDPAIR
jgi:hypothetical protein